MRLIGTVLLGWALAAQIVFQPTLSSPSFDGRLAGAVLLGGAPLAAHDLPAKLAETNRLRLEEYLQRWSAFRTEGPPPAYDEPWARRERRERLEREIGSTISREGIERVAQGIAWSGAYAASPFDPELEATWAEGLLRDRANASAAPYLYAFLASRYRMQFERADEDRPTLERLAKKYKTMLERVRNAGDPLFVMLADDLDAKQRLSPGATRHPRQYLPDT